MIPTACSTAAARAAASRSGRSAAAGTASRTTTWRAYASAHGDRWSLTTQLDFIWYELTTFGYGSRQLKAATTITAAVKAFQDQYEICGTCDSSNRIHDAEDVFAHSSSTAGTRSPNRSRRSRRRYTPTRPVAGASGCSSNAVMLPQSTAHAPASARNTWVCPCTSASSPCRSSIRGPMPSPNPVYIHVVRRRHAGHRDRTTHRTAASRRSRTERRWSPLETTANTRGHSSRSSCLAAIAGNRPHRRSGQATDCQFESRVVPESRRRTLFDRSCRGADRTRRRHRRRRSFLERVAVHGSYRTRRRRRRGLRHDRIRLRPAGSPGCRYRWSRRRCRRSPGAADKPEQLVAAAQRDDRREAHDVSARVDSSSRSPRAARRPSPRRGSRASWAPASLPRRSASTGCARPARSAARSFSRRSRSVSGNATSLNLRASIGASTPSSNATRCDRLQRLLVGGAALGRLLHELDGGQARDRRLEVIGSLSRARSITRGALVSRKR